jgi:hypothetical protein
LTRALAESARKPQVDARGKKNKRQKHKTPTATPTTAATRHAPAPPAARPDAKSAPSAPQSGKLSQQSSAQAHAKEPVFDALEEDFFARESEHLEHPPTVEDFADLEHEARRKLSPKRNWFGFGDGKKK